MDKLREHLRKELAKKVDAYGIVVWDDAGREYVDVASGVVPADVVFSVCVGSWYEVRRNVERSLAGDRSPRLLVYAPYPAPLSDPLAEIREAGGEFKLRLPTLLRNVLSGELTETRIEQIGRQASTLAEAEAALASDSGADVRLINIVGTSDVTQMAIKILSGDVDREIADAALWPETVKLLAESFGGTLEGTGEQLRRSGMRHLVLTELAERGGGPPDARTDIRTVSATDQRKRALHTLGIWRRDRAQCRGYAELAVVAQSELGLESALIWSDGLVEVDSVPLIEGLALDEFVRRVSADEVDAARELARKRLASSMWVRESLPVPLEGRDVWEPLWRAASELARLRAEIDANPPAAATVAEQLRRYADSAFRVDAAHRRLELALSRLEGEGVLEGLVGDTRGLYERWLEDSLLNFTAAVASGGFDTGELSRQGQLHDRHVKGAEGPVAYIWVDALRYEIGAELAERLKDHAEKVEFGPAVAAIPTITPVGMANLCPGGDLAIELTASSRLLVKVGDTVVKGVPERENLLRAAHGEVTNLALTQLFDQGEKQLAIKMGSSQLVLVRSQEMDSAGESGLLAAAWSSFETVRDLLERAVARLAQAGVRRVVISADHGFVVLSRSLGADRVIDAPKGGTGELHRRGWVGKGAITPANTIRIPLSDAGERSDLDLIAPRGLAVFAAGGDKRFFHGGLSPQELLVPVIVVEPKSVAAPQKLKVQVAIAGEKVTTGVFSAMAVFDPDLFNDELVTRVVVRRVSDKLPVARVVAGDGFDADAGTVTLAPTAQAILTFQVIENLDVGDEVEVQVLDAGTDRPLASGRAQVTARVVVEEDLG